MGDDFAVNILRALLDKEISVIVSPLSISCALALCSLGANGETEKQIYDVIDEGLTFTEIHKKFSQIISAASDLNVLIVNTVYVSKSISLTETYKNDVKEFYNGNYEIVDFSNGVETAKKINNMVATVTNQKIKQIVDAKKFSGTTAVAIINAIYLEKIWLRPFILMGEKVIFFSDAEKCEEIPFLQRKKGSFRHFFASNYQALELPYNDQTFSMIIILPHERFGLSEMLSNLDIKNVLQNISCAKKVFAQVCIPKFNIESSFDVTEILKNLGITYAFGCSNADFSKMCNQTIFVSSVIHKSCIEVSEVGTIAAAATSVEYEFYSLGLAPIELKFVADHPFLYLIINQLNNSIYFIGTFYNK